MFRKLLVNLLATVVLMGMIASPAMAAKTPPPPEEDFNMGIQTLDLISHGECTMTTNSDGTIYATGDTQAQYVMDSVGVKLFLQQWDGSSWNDIDSSVTFTEYNTDFISEFNEFSSIQSGYYYRIKAKHFAEDGGNKETTETFSNYEYVE